MKLRQIRHRRRERLVVLRFRFLILEKSRDLSWRETIEKINLNSGYGRQSGITSLVKFFEPAAHTTLKAYLEVKPEESPKETEEPGVIPTGFKDKYDQLFKENIARRAAVKKRYFSYIKMFGPNIVKSLRREDDKGLFDRYYPKKKELEAA